MIETVKHKVEDEHTVTSLCPEGPCSNCCRPEWTLGTLKIQPDAHLGAVRE